jgi:hypothetical protein
MSTYLALDKVTNDIIFPAGGGVTRVDEGRFVVQQVSSKLKTLLGEWALDPSIGWIKIGDFKKNYDFFEIEDRARSIILATDGVSAVISITSSLVGRRLDIAVEAKTIYGDINLTIPWGGIT